MLVRKQSVQRPTKQGDFDSSCAGRGSEVLLHRNESASDVILLPQ
jgi:hypothetical protein